MDPGDEDDGERARALLEVKPPRLVDWFPRSFNQLANAFAARNGGPLYLVGSALEQADPGDVDLRAVLEDHDLDRLFGPREEHNPLALTRFRRRWLREELKQSRRLSRAFGLNIDYQIQSTKSAKQYEHKPRLRLDTIPDDFFQAGLGNP